MSAVLGAQLAVNSVQSKLSDASDAVFGGENTEKRSPETARDSVTSSKSNEQDEEQESEEPEPLVSCKDFFTDPCLFLPIIVMQAACYFGLAMLIYAVAGGSQATDVIVGLVLLGVGFFAALEIRMLGSMADQINRLKLIRSALEASTARLSVEVEGFSAENEELEENVLEFRQENTELGSKVADFDKKNDELRELHAQLEAENVQLKEETRAISSQNEKLKDTVSAMSDKHDELTESLGAFDELRNNLSMMAENQGEQMADLIDQSMDTFSRMDDMLLQNEDVILNQLAADVEGIDRQLGMSEMEFKRFVARLPKRYKKLVKEKNITFQTYDKDGDGSIYPDELRALIARLIEECNNKHE